MANKNFKARIGIEAPLVAADDGTTALTLTGANVVAAGTLDVTGNLTVVSNTIKSSTATAITLSGADVTVAGDLRVVGNDIKSSGGTTAITLSGANATVAGDLTVTDAVVFNGATSGSVTIAAPAVAGTQAYTLPTALPAVTGYVLSGTTGGALSWVSNSDANTTYTIDASATTGGANLNLVGSDASTDTVKIASGTGVTVAQTSANELSVAIGQAVGTTADVVFNTVNANLTDDNYVLGQLIATRNTAYVSPPSALTTIAGQNGFVVSSSSGGAGYGANITVRYHSADTTAGLGSAASLNFSGASGTNSAPGGAATNQVLGSNAYDGYTAGTSNAYAGNIATANQGGGTTSLVPLQAQGYARQAFTNSVTATTAVTGASGTGSVATLTFTTQNTAPYAVGQSVTVAGMTPSGYNGSVVITAATTSSISYANATTGFTSGGTIAAVNTVTAAGTGFRVRGFANSTAMTVGNRFNFMDLTASNANFKSAAYSFANDVITGSTLTANTYLSLTSSAHTIGNIDGPISAVRASAANTGTRPVMFLRNGVTATTTPATGDGASFRLQASGSNGVSYNLSQISGVYSSTGDSSIGFDIANGDQNTATMGVSRVVDSKLSGTTISATASPTATPGGNTLTTVAQFTPANTTIKSNAVTLQTNAGVALVGSAVSYNRVFGQFELTTTTTPAAANTAAVFALGTSTISNIATVGSTSRLIPGAAGYWNFQFSVQAENADNSSDHDLYIWLRKNGTDVVGSTGRYTLSKSTSGSLKILGWNFVVETANTTDYFELAYAVDSTQITFPAFAVTAFAPSTASLVTTLTPVGV